VLKKRGAPPSAGGARSAPSGESRASGVPFAESRRLRRADYPVDQQECLDHFLIFGDKHFDCLVREYVEHYHTGTAAPKSGKYASLRPAAAGRAGRSQLPHVGWAGSSSTNVARPGESDLARFAVWRSISWPAQGSSVRRRPVRGLCSARLPRGLHPRRSAASRTRSPAAADYTVWRNTLGSMTDYRAESTGPIGVPDHVVDRLRKTGATYY
jgi:hypothetical protein